MVLPDMLREGAAGVQDGDLGHVRQRVLQQAQVRVGRGEEAHHAVQEARGPEPVARVPQGQEAGAARHHALYIGTNDELSRPITCHTHWDIHQNFVEVFYLCFAIVDLDHFLY